MNAKYMDSLQFASPAAIQNIRSCWKTATAVFSVFCNGINRSIPECAAASFEMKNSLTFEGQEQVGIVGQVTMYQMQTGVKKQLAAHGHEGCMAGMASFSKTRVARI